MKKKPATAKTTTKKAAEAKKPAAAAAGRAKHALSKAEGPAPGKAAAAKVDGDTPAAGAKKPRTVKVKVAKEPEDPAALRALAERAQREAKELDEERRRLSSFAHETERALQQEAVRRAQHEKRISELEARRDELEALVAEHRLKLESAIAERDAALESAKRAAANPEAAKAIEELKSRVRALGNERDGMRERVRDLESAGPGKDTAKLEKLEERCMVLERERDLFKEKLTEAESQLGNAATPEVVERLRTSLADAEARRDKMRERVIAVEAEIAAIRGAPPAGAPGHPSLGELSRRLDESEREREKIERERDELEKKLVSLKADVYARKNAPDDRDTRFCPACGTEMRGQVLASVRIDSCPQCEGIYLDKGELQAIVAQERDFVKQTGKTTGFWGRFFGGGAGGAGGAAPAK